MAGLTYAQLEGVWLQAAQGTRYGTQAWAALMAAIGLAESGGDPAATNPTDNGGRQTSWGIWQISNGTHSSPGADWASPVGNAKLAIAKLDSQGLSAWGTYDSGAYRRFMSGGTTPDPNFPAGPGAAGGADATLTAAAASNQGGSSACLLGFPGFAGIGSFCVLSKAQARGLLGGALLATGALAGVAGLFILAAASFKGTGAGHAAGGALEAAGAGLAFIPGAEPAGLALGAAGATARRAGSSSAARGSLDRRQAARETRAGGIGE